MVRCKSPYAMQFSLSKPIFPKLTNQINAYMKYAISNPSMAQLRSTIWLILLEINLFGILIRKHIERLT